MTVSSHVEVLRKKHQALSDMVDIAQRSPATDDLKLKSLKKQKLHLKEAIERLARN